jgi:hypothetical protein
MAGRKRKDIREQAVADLRKRYDFFKKHGGGRVGHAAEDAFNLARAERIAETLDWDFEWKNEEEDWEEFLGDVPREDVSRIEYCVLKDDKGKVLASLGGIMFGYDAEHNRDYPRVVEAELALEALHEKGLL